MTIVLERRRFPRMDPEIVVKVRTEERGPIEGTCIDLSVGGALVRCGGSIATGQNVELYLSKLGAGRPLRIRGEVMRRASDDDEAISVIAVRFDEPDGTTLLELEELLSIEHAPPAPAERRTVERHEARFLVTFHTEREFLHEYTENISSHGLFLVTDEKVEVGTEVDVELVLPNYHDPIDLRARVTRRVTPDPQLGRAGGLGIEFLEPDRRTISFVEERANAYRSAGL